MADAYLIVVFVHVVAGALGLGSVGVPLLACKGSRLHDRAGWVFTVAMAVAAATGVLVSLSWLTIPAAVKDLPDTEQGRAMVGQLRVLGLFFLLLSLFAAHALASGIHCIRARHVPSPKLKRLTRGLAYLVPMIGTVVLVAGALTGSVLLLVFGGLGMAEIAPILREGKRPPAKNAWLLGHVDAMLGAATVTSTAFAVQMAGRLADATFAVWAWAVPVALGMTATHLWKRSILVGRAGRRR